MHKKIKELDFNKIKEILSEYDRESVYNKVNILPNSDDLYQQIEKYVDTKSFNKKAVLGIDIYKYGMYKHLEQTLIPSIFKILFDKAIKLCLENNKFVFQHYTKERIENSYISTGDGGFVIFDTPLHALFFSINFEMMVRTYNSYHLYPKLRDIIGSINLRYAITYDTVYYFEKNHYGSAIIFNSRILERDSLNRCLIDQDTYNWFLINIDGIENLQVLTINEVFNIYEFQSYDKELIRKGENEIMNTRISRYSGIINSDVSKIGQIASKGMDLNIYNLHLQITMKASSSPTTTKRTITISLGNLNTAGI
jgi:hypothetical protein